MQMGFRKSSKKHHRTTTKAACKLTSTPTIPHVKKVCKWVLEKVLNKHHTTTTTKAVNKLSFTPTTPV
jgi:hypothetical protein